MFSFNKLLDHKGFSGLDFYLALTPKTWEPGRKLTITLSASMHINHLSSLIIKSRKNTVFWTTWDIVMYMTVCNKQFSLRVKNVFMMCFSGHVKLRDAQLLTTLLVMVVVLIRLGKLSENRPFSCVYSTKRAQIIYCDDDRALTAKHSLVNMWFMSYNWHYS